MPYPYILTLKGPSRRSVSYSRYHWHPPRSLGTGKKPSRSSDAGWRFTGCHYFGSSLTLDDPSVFCLVYAHPRLIYLFWTQRQQGHDLWKKSTKKSPAYGRGFKPNFSVTDRDVNLGINIKNRPVGHWVLKARGVRWSTGTWKGEARTIVSA